MDWNRGIPADISCQRFDIILVADCMYNSDAAPALVAIIKKLTSANTVLCVAHKRRHASEDRFFQLLRSSGLGLDCRTTVNIGVGDVDDGDGVDLYTMQGITDA